MINVPCGRTTGHGESCCEGHLCDQCWKLRIIRNVAYIGFVLVFIIAPGLAVFLKMIGVSV